MEALPEPALGTAVDAAPSYFTQRPVYPSRPTTPPEDKEEHATIWPLRSLRRWFSKAPKIRKDTLSSPSTSRTSASSPNTHKWIAPSSPVSPADGIGGCTKHEGKNGFRIINGCKLTRVRS